MPNPTPTAIKRRTKSTAAVVVMKLRSGLSALVVATAVAAMTTSSMALASTGQSIDRPKLQHRLDRLVAAGAPGAVALVRDGDLVSTVTSGYANVATHQQMRAQDRFRIGSLTKTFASTVVLQLVGEGAISLEDTVERWLPGVVPNGQAITIRMLLNHTSGLFDYPQDQHFIQRAITHPTRPWPLTTLLSVALAHRPLFAPGTRWSYSNSGYIALGLVVQSVTGESLADQIRQRILEPLQLHSTTFDQAPRMRSPYAHGYLLVGKPPAVDASAWSPSFGGTAGAMVSDARDLAAFLHALFNGRLLATPLMQQMEKTVYSAPNRRYGLGLMRKRSVGGATCDPMWGHDGDFPGYRADAYSTADGRRQIVVLVNQMRGMLPSAAKHAQDAVIATAFCG